MVCATGANSGVLAGYTGKLLFGIMMLVRHVIERQWSVGVRCVDMCGVGTGEILDGTAWVGVCVKYRVQFREESE